MEAPAPSSPQQNNQPKIEPLNTSELSFQVMPRSGHYGDEVPNIISSPRRGTKHGRTWVYILIIIILLAGLGAGAYFMLGTKAENPAQDNEPTTKLPKPWLEEYFQTEDCTEPDSCADESDPDDDGLANYDEFVANTSPINSDTDEDGLADGDEVYVYKTEPSQKFTDRRPIVAQNNWTDGYQIKSGFDPLTPGLKFTDARQTQMASDVARLGLHEPTIATLKTVVPQDESTAQSKTVSILIENGKFIPDSIDINIGDTVVWTNKDAVLRHIASDPHPTHTGMPGLESDNLNKGDTYSIKFDKIGTFGYHDHLNPTLKAKIVVK